MLSDEFEEKEKNNINTEPKKAKLTSYSIKAVTKEKTHKIDADALKSTNDLENVLKRYRMKNKDLFDVNTRESILKSYLTKFKGDVEA